MTLLLNSYNESIPFHKTEPKSPNIKGAIKMSLCNYILDIS